MLTCKEVTELASKQQDTPLPFKQRMQLKIHLMMCKFCNRYLKQLNFLKTAIQRIDHHSPHPLPDESRNRIRATLEKEVDLK